jgi:hypothetical protein
MIGPDASRIIVTMDAPTSDEYNALCAEIQTLLEPPGAETEQSLERLEDTLTVGYARALALEAEQLRLERQIGALGADVGRGEPAGADIASLAARLSHTSGRLTGLRALLTSLRERANAVRMREVARSGAG